MTGRRLIAAAVAIALLAGCASTPAPATPDATALPTSSAGGTATPAATPSAPPRATAAPTAAPTARTTIERTPEVAFTRPVDCGDQGPCELRLDVLAPPGEGPHPTVVLVSGAPAGPDGRSGVGLLANALARRGVLVFLADYRAIGSGGGYPQSLEDVSCALRFARAHAAEYAGDPAGPALVGYSLGGLMTVGVALSPAASPAACLAPGDPRPALAVTIAGDPWPDTDNPDYVTFLGGTRSERPEAWAGFDARTLIGGNPGVVLRALVGSVEPEIRANQDELDRLLREADYDTAVIEIPRADHAGIVRPSGAGAATVDAIIEVLTGPEAVGPPALGAVPPASLPATVAADLDAFLEGYVAERGLSGMAAAVVTRDGTWSGASGAGDPATGTRLTPDAEFGIGSISKTIVAALVLRAVEIGAMDLDAPLAEYLPPSLAAIAGDATVRVALRHRSGLLDSNAAPGCTRTWTAEEVAALSPPATGAAGASFRYANVNFVLAGIALEGATGRTLGELTRDLLDPLGLTRIVYQPDEPPPPPHALAHIDFNGDGRWDSIPATDLLPCRGVATALGAAGGYAADALSVARWGWLLYGGGVLEPRTVASMTNLGEDGYGLGTSAQEIGAARGFGHNGSIDGYVSTLIVLPDEGVSIAVLVNSSRDDVLGVAADRLLRIVRGG